MAKPSFYLNAPEIHLCAGSKTRLSSFWNHLMLGGCYWRLYHHTAHGAGVFLDGKKIELVPEKLYLLPPNCNLRTWSDGVPEQLYIHFEVENISGSRAHLLNGVELAKAGCVAGILEELHESFAQENCPPARRKLLALSLLTASIAKLPKEAFSEIDCDRRIINACDFIRSNTDKEINLSMLAHIAGLSENVFLRDFKAQTGSTPYQYLLHVRYTQAARLLQFGNCTIDEICYMIGVNDRFHFSRTFKRMYGVPPAQYRKHLQEQTSAEE